MKKEEVGHHFLARLGKTRLRPGGKQATDWLIAKGNFSKDKQVLEVACNICTTAIALAKTYGCHITGIDLDHSVLEKARRNIHEQGVADRIEVMHGNATRLPFANNSFDIVLNEAMLTMLPLEAKQNAVSEYLRVLKPNGILLTHDVLLNAHDEKDGEQVLERLRDAIQIKVTPLTESGWRSLFLQAGFQTTDVISGEMSLLSPRGLIRDEGLLGALKIVRNAMKAENRARFRKMFKTFNDPACKLGFIAMRSRKTA
ncbi:MAG: methyltransferase domain-containing protein [Brachymonas sp.]|nr:methyltransferase domain-containing protein [Brachymonas sp.]